MEESFDPSPYHTTLMSSEERVGLYDKLLRTPIKEERNTYITILLQICKTDVCKQKLGMNLGLAKQLKDFIEAALNTNSQQESVELTQLYIYYFICLWYCNDKEGSAGYTAITFRLIDKFSSIDYSLKLKAQIYKIIILLHSKKVYDSVTLLLGFTETEIREFAKEAENAEKDRLLTELNARVQLYKNETNKPPAYHKYVSCVNILQAGAHTSEIKVPQPKDKFTPFPTVSSAVIPGSLLVKPGDEIKQTNVYRKENGQPEPRKEDQRTRESSAERIEKRNLNSKITTEEELQAAIRDMGAKYERYIECFQLFNLKEIKQILQQDQETALKDLCNMGINSSIDSKLIYRQLSRLFEINKKSG